MKFSATVTLQYDTIFSSFSPADYLKGLDWMKANRLDGAELCISNYNNLDVAKIPPRRLLLLKVLRDGIYITRGTTRIAFPCHS